MKLIIIILTVFLVQVSASTNAQQLTLKDDHILLKEVLQQIRKQTGYTVLYKSNVINKAKPINLNLYQVPLEEALKKILSGQNLDYTIKNKAIFISEREEPSFLDRVVDAFTPPINISGLVLDEKGLPLPGVTVKVKGSGKATSTGNDGRFYLTGVDDDAVIEIRMVGYKVLEIPVKGKFEGLRMEPVSKELEEVVVAYGKTTQQALTGAVTVVKGEQIADLPNRSFDKSLQGLVPGLQITQGTGQPGGGVANMVLRGISTGSDVSSGSTVRNPLIVIDGIPVSQDNFRFLNAANVTPISNPLAQLNPSDIETISVLKDAVAIALYGSSASNGVILVTTKKGKAGKTVFGFRHQTDIAFRPVVKTDVLNKEEYLDLLYNTYKNTSRIINNVPAPWNENEILADLKSKFPVRADGSFYATPDWNGELFTSNASTISNDINMSGGNDKSSFYLNFEYTKQNGAVSKTGYDRKSLRFNFESRPSAWLKLGTNTALSYNIQNYSNNNEGATGFAAATIMSPLNPVRLENGNYQLFYPFGMLSSTSSNQVAAAEYNINRNVAYRGLSKFYAEARVLPGVTLSSSLGADFMLIELKQKTDPRFFIASNPPTTIAERDDRRANIINTNTLRIEKNFKNDHSIEVLLGQEAQIKTQKLLGAEAEATIETLPYFEQLSSPGYTMSDIDGTISRQTLLSVFSQVNYAYRNKYFFSGSIRKDGSSKFGDQQQWGTYWSTGAGWLLTEERFLNKKVWWLNYLKIRGSIGAAGNSGAVDAATRFDRLAGPYKFSGSNAVTPSGIGNPDIRWEETFSWDAGIEIKLLEKRLSFTADFYNKKTKGLIYSTNLSSVSGTGSVSDNIGDIKNSGIELSLSGVIMRNTNFQWNLNTNWSTNKNILIRADVPLASISGGILANEEGRNFNSFYLPKWLGVNPADGKPLWIDANGNPTSTYAAAKKEFVGKPQPDGYGAITNVFKYKDFELSVQLYYQYGLMVYNNTMASVLLTDGRFPYANQLRQGLDYWKKPGDIANNPRRSLNNTADRGNSESTRYLFKGDYLRIQYVSLGYNLPKSILNFLHLSSLRIYAQGNNLALFTLFPGADPDNANVGGSTAFAYPNQSSFSAGLNVSF